MTAIYEVTFNKITHSYETTGDGGEPGKYDQSWSNGESWDKKSTAKFSTLTGVYVEDGETLAAEDVEDAIKKLKIAVIGKKDYWQMDTDEDGNSIEDGQWFVNVVDAVQIVSVKPTAFTTI